MSDDPYDLDMLQNDPTLGGLVNTSPLAQSLIAERQAQRKYRIWRHDTETSYAEVEADSAEAAEALIQDGDEAVEWTSTRYNADYETEEVQS